jgi:hypothetical protein
MEFHFSSFQLIINEQTPSLEDLKPILNIGVLSINFLYLFLLLKVFLNGLEEEANNQI